MDLSFFEDAPSDVEFAKHIGVEDKFVASYVGTHGMAHGLDLIIEAANEGFFKRTLNYVFYMMMAISVAPFLPKADIVISTSPQFFNGLAGYFVSRLKRAAWVLEIRDLWPESILAVGAVTNKRVIKVLEGIERFVYRKADHIVSVSYTHLTLPTNREV